MLIHFIYGKLKPFFLLGFLYLIISFILRCIFMLHPITTSDFGVFDVVKLLVLGGISDVFIFSLISGILAIYFLFLNNAKFQKPYSFIMFAVLLGAFIYVYSPYSIFREYGGVLPEISIGFVGLKLGLFILMWMLPQFRLGIRKIMYFITLLLYVFVIIQIGVSEYFFWNEFGVRFNFIAVDYLIYTNEVIGNIMESYPMIPISIGMAIVTFSITGYIFNTTKTALNQLPNFLQKIALLLSFIIISGISLLVLPNLHNSNEKNIFKKEIQANGSFRFYQAFMQKELDFNTFYSTLNPQKAKKIYLESNGMQNFPQQVVADSATLQKNVVLISIESLSADFMKHYGNTQNITPFLDSLMDKSLNFTQVYATGNRTVRGLEALSMCLPPTPGESIVKRQDNKNKNIIGKIFKENKYDVKFLYGGYSYFDNMYDFFHGNNYQIIDKNNFKPEEISFSNVWGVCDEDMAKKAIATMNTDAQQNKKFFHHWMTVSNHRPFTYPDGKIDIPGNAKSREGGVKYTDYALRRFFAMAKKQAWFDDTVFIIISDHCASSAGKTELPMDKYRIPAFVYAPKLIKAQHYTKLMSQIDVMPTVLGLLNINYTSQFLGQDVLKPTYQERAYIATYQDLGYVKNNVLNIISPNKKIKQYRLEKKNSEVPSDFQVYYNEIPMEKINTQLANECIATYQTTALFLKDKKLDRK